MDIDSVLRTVKEEYGVDAYTFRRDDGYIGITIEGPEAVIQEKVMPVIIEMIKNKLFGGLFSNVTQANNSSGS